MTDTDLAYEAGREDGIAEATKAIAEAMKLLRRDALDEDTDRDWRWGVKHSIWVIERSLQEQAAAAPAPYDRCPFCGTPGRIVGSDEGTQHFEATPAPQAEGLDVERLARALDEVWPTSYAQTPEMRQRQRDTAEAIARAYADAGRDRE